MGQEDYESLEKAFHLHAATLPGLFKSTGVCSAFNHLDHATGEIRRVSTILRPSSIWQNSIFAVSQTYDLSSRQSTALVVGYGLVGHALTTQTDYIRELLQANSSLWTHPALIPSIFLRAYGECYKDDVLGCEGKTTQLEGSVGATSYWKWTEEQESERASIKSSSTSLNSTWSKLVGPTDWPASVDVKTATLSIHFHASAVYQYLASVKWHRDSIQFLLDLQTRTERRCLPKGRFPAEWESMRDQMEYHLHTTEQMVEHLQWLQQRVQTQTNVLYSATSQKDNLVASRIASSTKKDSIAMMAFTFITAFFLPGTYIASVFSTGMFDWMPANSSGDDHQVVSTRFWIYWVTTVPLTTAVMAGWYFWYRAADAEWRRTTQLEIHTEGAADEDEEEEDQIDDKDPAHVEKQASPTQYRFRDRWHISRSGTSLTARDSDFPTQPRRSKSGIRERF
ncbi:hypothetical protein, variant [Phialophora macrospora]|nr:hypothetical protein, variant [Phialophora macrospora]